jgi:hypothetical protein
VFNACFERCSSGRTAGGHTYCRQRRTMRGSALLLGRIASRGCWRADPAGAPGFTRGLPLVRLQRRSLG